MRAIRTCEDFVPSAGVRALQRGLELLQEVNRSGGIKPGDLAQRLAMARPTVYRLLETLEQLGYVMRSASDGRFRVTRRASSLGDGYDAGVLVGEAAGPILIDLSRRIVWPIDLSIYEDAAMIIQESTHARSPLSIDRGMIGRRIPMLRTAAGRAYLAACPQSERDAILRHLALLDDPEDRPFLDKRVLDTMLRQTARRGYALRDGTEYNPKTASIGVAIRGKDGVLGCLTVIWIRGAIKTADACRQFASSMREAAEAVARRCDERTLAEAKVRRGRR